MKALGIILAGGDNELRLKNLTSSRAAAAMPVGSSYRAVDFSLSNMTNSGINKVAVMTQFNSRSLRDHLSSSKWWDFGRKTGGLFVLSPFKSIDNSYWFRGTADSIYQNLTYLRRSNEEYVVIASGDIIYKIDFRDVINYHVEKNADITVVAKRMPDKDMTKLGVMELNEENRILAFEEKPECPKTDMASLGIYVISRELLIRLLDKTVPKGKYDFVNNIVVEMLEGLKEYAYEFNGYWSTVGGGILDYYNANMDFLKKEVRELFTSYPFIASKPKDEPPVKYNFRSEVTNTLAGTGCIINGRVENSVLFRKIYIGDHTFVSGSIIMEGSYIGDNCIIKNAILDKEVRIADGVIIEGEKGEPVIVKKGAVIEDGEDFNEDFDECI